MEPVDGLHVVETGDEAGNAEGEQRTDLPRWLKMTIVAGIGMLALVPALPLPV